MTTPPILLHHPRHTLPVWPHDFVLLLGASTVQGVFLVQVGNLQFLGESIQQIKRKANLTAEGLNEGQPLANPTGPGGGAGGKGEGLNLFERLEADTSKSSGFGVFAICQLTQLYMHEVCLQTKQQA